jgi:hypothetical protein
MNTNTVVTVTHPLVSFHRRNLRREWPPPEAPGASFALRRDKP